MEAAGAAAAQEVRAAGNASSSTAVQSRLLCAVSSPLIAQQVAVTLHVLGTAVPGMFIYLFLAPTGISCVSMCHPGLAHPARLGVTHLHGEAESHTDTNLSFHSSLPKDSGWAPCIHPDRHVLEREQNSLGL